MRMETEAARLRARGQETRLAALYCETIKFAFPFMDSLPDVQRAAEAAASTLRWRGTYERWFVSGTELPPGARAEGFARAFVAGRMDIARRALDKCTPEERCAALSRAVVLLAGRGKTDAVRSLLDLGLDGVQAGEQALEAASQKGHTDTVRLLLQSAAFDLGALAKPFIAAAEGGHTETLEVLYDAICPVFLAADQDSQLTWGSRYYSRAFYGATRGGHTDCTRRLLGTMLGQPSRDGIILAASGGHLECMMLFVRDYPCPSHTKALTVAARQGQVHCVRALLGIPGTGVEDALRAATDNGYAECVGAILDSAPDTATAPYYMDIVVDAARRGHLECLRRLARPGMDATEALIAAYRGEHHGCWDFMVSMPGLDAGNVLVSFAQRGIDGCVRRFLHRDITPGDAQRALVAAAQAGHAKCVKEILRYDNDEEGLDTTYALAVATNEECRELLL